MRAAGNLPLPTMEDTPESEILAEIQASTQKPTAYAAQPMFPFDQLDDRTFEVAIYSIYHDEVIRRELGSFTSVALMREGKDRGRDVALRTAGVNTGLVQCKRVQEAVTKPTLAREAIKYSLHAVLDPKLIGPDHPFRYWLASTAGVVEKASELEGPGSKLLDEKQYPKWVRSVIAKYRAFDDLSYGSQPGKLDVTSQLAGLLKRIDIHTLDSHNLSTRIGKAPHLIEQFFEVQKVVSEKAVLETKQAVQDGVQETTQAVDDAKHEVLRAVSEKRRNRISAVVVLLLLLALGAFGLLSWNSERTTTTALSKVKAAETQLEQGHLLQATLLAMEAGELRPELPEVEQVLRRCLDQPLPCLILKRAKAFCVTPITRDGTLVVAQDATEDSMVSVVEVASGRVVHQLRGHKRTVWHLAISPDDRLLATGSTDGTARIWDLRKGEQIAVLEGHEGVVRYVAFSPSGKVVATAGGDGTVRLWDGESGKQLWIQDLSSMATCIEFDPTGQRIYTVAMSGQANTVQVWDVRSGRELLKVGCHHEGVASRSWCSFNSNGTRLLVPNPSTGATLWDCESSDAACVIAHGVRVMDVAISPDDQVLLTTGKDGSVQVWGADDGTQLAALRGHEDSVTKGIFSPDGDTILTASDDQTVRLWERGTWQCKATLGGIGNQVGYVTCNEGGDLVVASTHWAEAWVWDVDRQQSVAELCQSGMSFVQAAFIPGQATVAACTTTTVVLWDTETDRSPVLVESASPPIANIDVSSDGTLLIVQNLDGSLTSCSLPNQEKVELHGPREKIQTWVSTLSPDGSIVAEACNDGVIRLVSASTGRAKTEFPYSENGLPISSVAYSPNGDWLAAVSGFPGTLHVWDHERRLVLQQSGWGERGHDLSWCGEDILLGSEIDGIPQAWAIPGGDETGRLYLSNKISERMTSIACSDSQRKAVTGHKSGLVVFWDVDTAAETSRIPEIAPEVLQVSMSPGGKRALVVGTDGVVRVYSASVQELLAQCEGRLPRGLSHARRRSLLQGSH